MYCTVWKVVTVALMQVSRMLFLSAALWPGSQDMSQDLL